MSIPSWARVGTKVVCVMAETTPDFSPPYHRQVLVEGATYTLSSVFMWAGAPCCDVVGENEFGFELCRFRPLITLDDDLKAHFAHLLDAPLRVSEEA